MKNIPITFRANFLPKVEKFRIEIITNEKRWVELMTIAKFLRWVNEIRNSDLKIGGIKVILKEDGNGEARKQINDYFKSVAEAYKSSKGYYRNN